LAWVDSTAAIFAILEDNNAQLGVLTESVRGEGANFGRSIM